MILVDPRKGSKDLFPMIARRVPCEMDDNLPAGDAVFEGFIEEGRGLIGVERKRISDMIDCMITGRFSGYQLIEMSQLFQWNYLVVEGMWRANPDTGFLETWSGRDRGWMMVRKGTRTFKYEDLDHHLTTLVNMTGVRYFRTYSADETAQLIVSKFTWHNNKPWNKHTSHLAIHQTPKPGDRVRVSFRKPPLRRVVSCDLPGISFDRSQAVERHFATTEAMINASVAEWMKIDGIGDGIARKVYEKVRSE